MPEALPHPVDTYVGMRVRVKRNELRLSQVVLAERLGLTFQQVQKYESGNNRISASKLFEIGEALSTPIAWFFEGLPSDTDAEDQADSIDALASLIATTDGVEVAKLWPRLSPKRRRDLFRLMQAMDWAN